MNRRSGGTENEGSYATPMTPPVDVDVRIDRSVRWIQYDAHVRMYSAAAAGT